MPGSGTERLDRVRQLSALRSGILFGLTAGVFLILAAMAGLLLLMWGNVK